MTPVGFDSWREFFRFGLAREYRFKENKELFPLEATFLERTGKVLSGAVVKPLDLIAQEIRNPLVLTALTVMSLFFVSVAFYPYQTWGILTRILPWVASISSSHTQAALYGISQSTILGLGLQAYGRLSHPELMAAYRAGQIEPVPIGASLKSF